MLAIAEFPLLKSPGFITRFPWSALNPPSSGWPANRAAVDPGNLMAARDQMAVSLGFHIILSCFGVAFPALIYVMHRRGLRGDADALVLAKRWSKVAAVLFAVGAVSGTVLSLEMGLLWPGLMSTYGDVIGLPFALEGIAFFIEAIFLGIYLFGWDRLPPKVHIRTLIPIMASGLFGTFCILAVNSWMNAPAGFTLVNGRPTNIEPLSAIFNRALWPQFLHMWVGAYVVVGFTVAAVYATGLRKGRDDRLHRMAFTASFAMATGFALVQPLIGHVAGMRLATEQPSKLAAMELATTTESHAPLTLGGVLIDGRVRGGLSIPQIGSLLARGGFGRSITGLDQIPADQQAPANVVHIAFQLMVAIGTGLAAFGMFYFWRRRRRRRRHRDRDRDRDLIESRRFLRLATLTGPAAIIALEAGWVTTEVGRQPWIVYRVLRVADAVTPNGGIWFSFSGVVVLYALLGLATWLTLRSMSQRWRATGDVDLPTPYGPPREPPADLPRPDDLVGVAAASSSSWRTAP